MLEVEITGKPSWCQRAQQPQLHTHNSTFFRRKRCTKICNSISENTGSQKREIITILFDSIDPYN